MSNSISIPYQGDALDHAVADAESKLKSENGVGVIIGLMIGNAVSHFVELTDNADDGMKVFCCAANTFMNIINKRHLPMDVIVRPVGWDDHEAALLRLRVSISLEDMAA
ncbi:hypothetical protein BV96_03660 [Sphingomonas paucimobilis]|nr:hypothetical protein BV96_03660 [Sphingomonas paucimobilis]